MRRLILLVSLAGLAACASSGSAGGGSTVTTRTQQIGSADVGRLNVTTVVEADVTTVPFDADAVFRVLPSVLDSLGLPVATIDPAGKSIGNPGFKIRNRLGKTPLSMILDCGNTQIGPNADSYDVYLKVMTTVSGAGAGSARIATLVEAQARPATYNQAYNSCATKGYLEPRLVDLVTRRLRK